MQKNGILISIVIVSSKSGYIEDCLDTVYKALENISNEIIVIDNASTDEIGDIVKSKFPKVIVIRREINGGFGENNNLGMKIAKGKYVLLLNDDTKIIDKNIFKGMINWMDTHPKVGISSSALVNPDLKNYQGSGGAFPTLGKVFAWMTFLDDIPGLDNLIKPYHPMHGASPFYKNEDYFKKERRQDWVTGAFYMMRKSAMEKIGYFDEDFFLYVEEVDLAYRFNKTGWETWYLPKWKIVHYGSGTIGNENALIYEMKNIVLFYKKHFPTWQLPLLKLILKFGALIRILIFTIYKGPTIGKIYIKAFSSI